MILERGLGFLRLARERPSAQIAGWAIFQNDPSHRQRFSKRRAAHHRDSVPDALRAKQVKRLAHRIRPAYFARMTYHTQAFALCMVERRPKIHRRVSHLVATHSESNHSQTLKLCRPTRYFHRGFRAKLAGRIENP